MTTTVRFEDVSFPSICEACDAETVVAQSRSNDPRSEQCVNNVCRGCGERGSVRWVNEW